MERSLISWNLPNLITVPLMAILGWFLLAIVWQIAMRGMNFGKTDANAGSGGY